MCKRAMNLPRDIEAEIYFLKPSEGGRSTPAFSGYRPQFFYGGRDWDAPHEYPDNEKVNPGETARAYLAFLSPQEHLGKVFVGMEFLVREGTRTVGRGKVTKILELEQSAARHAKNNT